MIARIALCVVFPFVIVWVVSYRLAREARHAFQMASLDVRIEFDEARRMWRRKSMFPEGDRKG